MAQTKTRGSKKGSSTSARSRSRKAQPKPNSKARSAKRNSNAADRLRDVPQVVERTGKNVGRTGRKLGRDVGEAASKAKTPLLAGGAAVAGAAGGMAIGAMRSRRSRGGRVSKALHPKHIKISSDDIAKAARGVGTVSQHVADLTSEMNSDRRATNGKRRSPIEVVLEGLTARR